MAQLDLGALLTIGQVAGLRASALRLLRDGAAIDIDGGAVEEVDTAGIQLLAALFKQAQAQRVSVSWCAVSGNLSRATRLLGLEALLGLPAEVVSACAGDPSDATGA